MSFEDAPKAKPCPFCGGRPAVQHTIGYWIDCTECGAQGPLGDTAAEATERWNKRV